MNCDLGVAGCRSFKDTGSFVRVIATDRSTIVGSLDTIFISRNIRNDCKARWCSAISGRKLESRELLGPVCRSQEVIVAGRMGQVTNVVLQALFTVVEK